MAEYDAHAADYDAWAADSIDDVQWYVSLARARETGKHVIGIDLRPGGRFAWNVFAYNPFVAVANEGNDVRNAAPDNRIDLVRNQGVLSLWWMTRAEQEGLIDVAGLEIEALFGGCHREPYDDTTYEMVWVARKP